MNLSYIPFDDSSSSSPPSPHLTQFPLSHLPPISKKLLNEAIEMKLNIGSVLNLLHELDYSLPEEQLINLLLDRYYSSLTLPLRNLQERQFRSSIPSLSPAPSQPPFNRSESWDGEGGRGERERGRGREEEGARRGEGAGGGGGNGRVLREGGRREIGLQEERGRGEGGVGRGRGRRGEERGWDGGRGEGGRPERRGTEECGICLGTQGEKAYLSCRHAFCENCLMGYLGSLIADGQVEITCPQDGCGRRMGEEEVARWIWKKRDLIIKYERFKRNRKIEKDPNLRFCTRPSCNGIVSKNMRDNFGRCFCGQEICFLCGNKAHHVHSKKQHFFFY